jgi:hypothetical protein
MNTTEATDNQLVTKERLVWLLRFRDGKCTGHSQFIAAKLDGYVRYSPRTEDGNQVLTPSSLAPSVIKSIKRSVKKEAGTGFTGLVEWEETVGGGYLGILEDGQEMQRLCADIFDGHDQSSDGDANVMSIADGGRAVNFFPAGDLLDRALSWEHGAVAEWCDGPDGKPNSLRLRPAAKEESGLKLMWHPEEESFGFRVPVPDGKRVSLKDEAPAGTLN